MLRLALSGGLYSGKSTLARKLVNDCGFTLVNYTDILKGFAAVALQSIGVNVSTADIKADKEKYRRFIIEVGTLLGFDAGYGIDDLVQLLDAQARTRVVFDCVRFGAQFELLRRAGFRLVRVETPYNARIERAAEAGVSFDAFAAKMADPSEQPLPHYPGEVSISVEGDLDAVVGALTAKLIQAGNGGTAQCTTSRCSRRVGCGADCAAGSTTRWWTGDGCS